MLILDKHLALERMVALAERLHESVPEPFKQALSLMAMPALPLDTRPSHTPYWRGVEAEAQSGAAAVR
ncbi:MAG TPA: hypothetical protein VEZ14_11415 [Dehalococcoidia bacterium]|nr:hypothetical protein [Dehalococcoidia bacterium]